MRKQVHKRIKALINAGLISVDRTGFRDTDLAAWHINHGFGLPAKGLGFLMLEFDHCQPVAMVEYRNEHTHREDEHDALPAMVDLADRAGIPSFTVVYAADFSWFDVRPNNDLASKYMPERSFFDEQALVSMLYAIRGRSVPDYVLQLLDEIKHRTDLPEHLCANYDEEKAKQWVDLGMSVRHRCYGYDCPAVDIDALITTPDNQRAMAIVEYKNTRATLNNGRASFFALRNLANRAGVPLFKCVYDITKEPEPVINVSVAGKSLVAEQLIGDTWYRLSDANYCRFLHKLQRLSTQRASA